MKFNKSTIIKIAVAVALAVVVSFVVKYLIKKGKERKENDRRRDDYAQMAAALANAQDNPPQLTTERCKNIAQNIKRAQYDEDLNTPWAIAAGWGTNEKLMKSSFEAIPTAADYLNVKAAYQEEYSSDMWTDVQGEYSDGDSDLLVLEKHLTKIAVPENMR